MPRPCSICRHEERLAIEKDLVAGLSAPKTAAKYRVSADAVTRHRAHLPAELARSEQVREEARAIDVMAEVQRIMERVNLLYDASDRWLRDPDDPTRYDIGPRAEEVKVIYTEPGQGEGKPQRRKRALSALLADVEATGKTVIGWETKHADPRDLHLKTADRILSQLELIAKLLGQIDDRPVVNILVSAEWVSIRARLVSALLPYPEAAQAAARALESAG